MIKAVVGSGPGPGPAQRSCIILNNKTLFLLRVQNMSDAMAVLPKLSTGLDVNVRFTGVADFEYTPECIVFDLLDIPLYHGWLVDPQVRDHAPFFICLLKPDH